MKIGDRIKNRREALNLSQDELAKRLGYKSRSSINKIERDASGLPQSKIAAIANALQTTPAYIMGWEEVQKKNNIQADIVLRMQRDDEFFAAVKALHEMDPGKLSGLLALLK